MEDNLLLLSNSQTHNMGFLEHAREALVEFLDGRRSIYFAPYAAKVSAYDSYTATIQEAFKPFNVTVTGLHTVDRPAAALRDAEVLFVGGGNSFRLLKTLQQLDVINVVRERVTHGELRYMGSSAGTNMSCPSLRTTNDMPIVQPASFASFGLISFQINPHYQDPPTDSTHMGETREQRILEFLDENDVPVVGLREGSWLRKRGASLALEGLTAARIFRRNTAPQEYKPGSDLSWLLTLPATFDQSQP
ncbi:dipeptidase PepE [Dictyobacter aurantiacus]|uniref:Peptidase E n=1 Tax=Dictyobacter aurantiacus TaxID=1936993 RepID=A0A401ZBT0_9CHLR|nr:dipeptidase PepE [Dictyobacter aurantiacus]GCE04340.1 peptidase E [Dictyobacter aurantiacus]